MKILNDVIIVGAGPAGISAALTLAKNKINVTILEKNDNLTRKSCGGAVSPRAVELYSELELSTDFFINKGYSVNNGKIESFEIEISGYSHNKKHGYMIDRLELDSKFREIALNKPQIEILFNSNVINVKYDNEEIVLEVKISDHLKTFKTNFLIAADGSSSIIKKKLINSDSKDQDIILTAGTILKDYRQDTSYIRFHEDILPTYSWLFPYKNGRTNVGIGIYKNVYKKNHFDSDIFNKLISKMDINFAEINLEKWIINTNSLQKKIFKRKVFFVGDAAGLVNPFTGEGIYYSLKSGISAAKSIVLMKRYKVTLFSLSYLYFMFNSILKLYFSKLLQLSLFYKPILAKGIFSLCKKYKLINNLMFRYFSNT